MAYSQLFENPEVYKDPATLLWAIYYIEQSRLYETNKGYESPWNMYLKYCLYYGYEPLPYTAVRKMIYSAFRARHVKLSTVLKDNTVIEHYNNKYGFPKPSSEYDKMYKQMIEGIRKCYGAFDEDPRIPILW